MNSLNKLKESPLTSASLLSRLLFWWVTPLVWKGRKQGLYIENLYKVLDEDKSEGLGNSLEIEWDKELSRKENPNLFLALFRLFGPQYLLLGILVCIGELIIQISQPLLLGRVIRYFEGEKTAEPAWLLILGLILTSMLYTVTHHTYFFQAQRQGMKIRIACSSLIYRKAIEMNLESLHEATGGQITNLLANDVNRFDQVLVYLHFIWVGPIQLAIVIYILWGYFGVYCLTGVTVLILLVPVQGFMGKMYGSFRAKTAIRTDNRVQLLTEVISAIRVIKMQAWELLFSSKVIDARESEIARIKKTAVLRAINLTIHQISSKFIIFITLLIYVLMGNHLTSEKVFVTIAFYNSVRRVFTYCIPFGINNLAETRISLQRIQEFLLKTVPPMSKQINSSIRLERVLNPVKNCPFAISIKDFSAKWDPSSSQLNLNNITLDIPQHSLIAVVGKTGSGKSSLLHAILKELTPSKGEILINGRTVSYAPQEAWIFEGTVRENITFGQPFESSWYNKVIDACALRQDIGSLSSGDLTLVGEKEGCLSGGQRARINLARAVYSKSEIILLDDPLSSVDTNVANIIIKECILKLLKRKTCILVTHKVQFLQKTDKIILLENGIVKKYGRFSEFLKLGVDFISETNINNSKNDQNECNKCHMRLCRSQSTSVPSSNVFKMKIRRVFSTSSEIIPEGWIEEKMDAVEEDEEDNSFAEVENTKCAEEPISASKKSREMYFKYFRSGTNIFGMVLLFILCVTAQTLYTGSDYWLQIWVKLEQSHFSYITDSNFIRSVNQTCNFLRNCTPPEEIHNSTVLKAAVPLDTNIYPHGREISIYAALFGSLAIVALIRTLYYFKICMNASINLHKRLFTSVLGAPITFFQDNPAGRILNVFASNIGIIDDLLPCTVYEAIEACLSVVGVLVVVSIVNPILLCPSALLICMLSFVRHIYIGSARNIKRLETIAKAPVFSHTHSSLNGLVTIRAFKAGWALRSQFDSHQDLHSSAWFLVLCTTRWLAFVVETVAVVFIACVAFSFLIFIHEGSEVGLAISSAMTLSAMFQWGVRMSAEAESQLISVERVCNYSKIAPEASDGREIVAKTYSRVSSSNSQSQLDSDWPSSGEIKFENFTVTSSCTQNFSGTGGDDSCGKTILNRLNFIINGGEKIGIVGRTGAGKSTLVSSIFRLIIPSEGTVYIDGKNISKIDLKELRRSISIIPQEPVLFDGTLRQNLDPEENRTDSEIWEAIRNVKLEQLVKDIPSGLYYLVGDRGSNFSLGQKQLLCLGRALLQQNKILVLDEATASLDKETDELVQKAIRENFSKCTTITIAHRLDTIIDCDKILVLDAGSLVEFDSPSELLSDVNSNFFKMVAEMGDFEAKSLIIRAHEGTKFG